MVKVFSYVFMDSEYHIFLLLLSLKYFFRDRIPIVPLVPALPSGNAY